MENDSVHRDASVHAAQATLRHTKLILFGSSILIVLITAAYFWGSWRQTSRDAWNELQALANLAQSNAQIHFDQYSRGFEQLGEQIIESSREASPHALAVILRSFLRTYPDLSGLVLVRPDGTFLADTAGSDDRVIARFNQNSALMRMLAKARVNEGLQFFTPVISPLIHVPVIRLCMPVKDVRGKLLFFIVAGLNLDRQTARMSGLLTHLERRNHFGVGIMRDSGFLIERWPMPNLPTKPLVEFLGKPRTGAIHRAISTHSKMDQGRVVGSLNVGQPGVYWGVFKRLSGFQAAAFVVVPREVIVHRWWDRIRFALFAELLGVAGGIWLAFEIIGTQKHAVSLSQRQTTQKARLERLQGLYQALLSCGDVILNATEDTVMLRDTCRHLVRSSLFVAAWVVQPDHNGRFHSIAASDPDAPAVLENLGLTIEECTGPVARAWLSGRIEFNNDHLGDPSLANRNAILIRKGWLSGVAIPIRRGGKPFAILGLAGSRVGLFDEEVLTLASQIGRQVSQGLDELDLKQRLDEEHRRESYLARHDALTGLPNRLALMEYLPQGLARTQRNESVLAVAVMDLDGFKPINDTWGHAAGDEILKIVGERLTRVIRTTDLVARLGGDEFALVLEGLSDPAVLPLALSHIHETLKTPFTLSGGRSVHIGFSLGVTLYPLDDGKVEALLNHADAALYEAKNSKISRTNDHDWWCLWTPPLTNEG